MVDKHHRSIIKAISWRVFGTIDTILISFLITRNVKLAFSIGGVDIFTKMLLYYLHERAWNRINFGRAAIKKQESITENS